MKKNIWLLCALLSMSLQAQELQDKAFINRIYDTALK
jgi:hypothetical protein